MMGCNIHVYLWRNNIKITLVNGYNIRGSNFFIFVFASHLICRKNLLPLKVDPTLKKASKQDSTEVGILKNGETHVGVSEHLKRSCH